MISHLKQQAKIAGKGLVTVISLLGLFSLSSALFAQGSTVNLEPVGEVCLADQPCVGQTASGGRPSGATASSAPAAATPAPAAATTAASQADDDDFDAAATYQQNCMACHATGAAGAPKVGDAEAWDPRLEKGMDAVVQTAVNGKGAMPPKGLCMTCTEEQLRAIIDYMVSQ